MLLGLLEFCSKIIVVRSSAEKNENTDTLMMEITFVETWPFEILKF